VLVSNRVRWGSASARPAAWRRVASRPAWSSCLVRTDGSAARLSVRHPVL